MDTRELILEIQEGVNSIPDQWRGDSSVLKKANLGLNHVTTLLAKNYEEPLVKRGFIDVVAGQRTYDLPFDCISGRVRTLSVLYSGTYYKLRYEDLNSLKDYEELSYGNNFLSLSGLISSDIYTIQGRQIVLSSAPTNSVTDGFEVWYVARPLRLGKILGQVTSCFDKAPLTATFSSPNLTLTFAERESFDYLTASDFVVLSGFNTAANNGTFQIGSIVPSTKTMIINVGVSGATETVIGSAKVSATRLVVDAIDDSLSDSDYITTSKQINGDGIGHYQVLTQDAQTSISCKTTINNPDTYSKAGYDISTDFLGVKVGDFVCAIGETGAFPLDDIYYNYVTQHAIVRLMTEAKEPVADALQALKDLEKEVRSSFSNRTQKVRIRNEDHSFRRG